MYWNGSHRRMREPGFGSRLIGSICPEMKKFKVITM